MSDLMNDLNSRRRFASGLLLYGRQNISNDKRGSDDRDLGRDGIGGIGGGRRKDWYVVVESGAELVALRPVIQPVLVRARHLVEHTEVAWRSDLGGQFSPMRPQEMVQAEILTVAMRATQKSFVYHKLV